MIPPRFRPLLQALHKKTSEGAITWALGEKSNHYVVELNTYKIRIFQIEEEGMLLVPLPGTVCAELALIENNEVFDRFPVYSTGTSDYKELSALYDIAKQSANGASRKIESIIRILENRQNRPPQNPPTSDEQH